MENIKISVIIPVYKTEKFLEKCIRSVMNQTLKELEIICINDGSPDNSLKILKSLEREDKRLKIINQENQGVSKARNTAITIAKGKYCINIDSDDWIEKNYLEEMYNIAEKKSSDIVISDIFVDFYYEENKNYVMKDLNINEEITLSGEEYINIFLTNNFKGYSCNKLIKRELYVKNNIKYNEKIYIFEDVEAILKLAYFSKRINKINKSYYHYIKHESIASNQSKEKFLNDINICFEEVNLFFIKNKKEYFSKKLLIYWYSSLFRILLTSKENNEKYINIIFKLLNEISVLNLIKSIKLIGFTSVVYGIILKIFKFKKLINIIKRIDKNFNYLRKIKRNLIEKYLF